MKEGKMGGACRRHGRDRKSIKKFWSENLKEKRSRGIHRHRWEDNIKIYLMKIECDGVHWIRLAQDRKERRTVLNTVMNIRVP
jgi:hypothetical protein